MADFNSTQAARQSATPPEFTPVYDANFKVQGKRGVLPASHGNTLAQNDRIKLFDTKLEADARPLFLKISNGAFGASVVLDIGTTANPNAIVDGLDISAASTGQLVVSLQVDAFGSAQDIYATLAGANPADNVGLDVELFYASGN